MEGTLTPQGIYSSWGINRKNQTWGEVERKGTIWLLLLDEFCSLYFWLNFTLHILLLYTHWFYCYREQNPVFHLLAGQAAFYLSRPLLFFFLLCVLAGELPVVNSINDQNHVLAKVSQQAVYDSEKKPSGYLAQLKPYGLPTSQEQMAMNRRKRLPPPTLSGKCWPN